MSSEILNTRPISSLAFRTAHSLGEIDLALAKITKEVSPFAARVNPVTRWHV